ncbi:hypothetical protein BGZ70_004235 [Mortierella alpina]|uniref:Uncharacterized protein n=1 Tax=Mortierella alpina TaxID=64518 RepID=A0A9P6JAQ7_MORAP|nr:hypothetical protein BGZ70_004235 [Mortierella alpina]
MTNRYGSPSLTQVTIDAKDEDYIQIIATIPICTGQIPIMRLIAVVLGLGALFLSTFITVSAQEIIAPEEWFESMKLAQGLVTRNLHNRGHKQLKHRNIHNKVNHNGNKNKMLKRWLISPLTSKPLKPPKKHKGYPKWKEIEARAREFNSFAADAIVAAPVKLQIKTKSMRNAKKVKGKKGKKTAADDGKKKDDH